MILLRCPSGIPGTKGVVDQVKRTSLAVIAVILAGCGSGHSLAGKWTNSAADWPGAIFNVTFTEPDKMSSTLDIPEEVQAMKFSVHGDLTGTYKLEGDTITLHFDDAKISETGLPAAAQAIFDAKIKDSTDQMKAQMNSQASGKITWTDNDHFSVTGSQNKPQTFTRVK